MADTKPTTISEILSASPACEGPEMCWYNPETGYTEFCQKHDGMLLDADYAMREASGDHAPPSELLTREPWEENGTSPMRAASRASTTRRKRLCKLLSTTMWSTKP